MNRNKANLVALAVNAKMGDALAALNILDAQPAKLLTPNAVIEQGGQNRPIPFPFERVSGRRIEQCPRLGIAQCWRRAFIGIKGRSFDPILLSHRTFVFVYSYLDLTQLG